MFCSVITIILACIVGILAVSLITLASLVDTCAYEEYEAEVKRQKRECAWYRDELHKEVESRKHVQELLRAAQQELRKHPFRR